MKVGTRFPMDENLTRAQGTPPVQEVYIECTPEEAKRLFHDLNRTLSLLDSVCPNLMDNLHPDDKDKKAYDRVDEFVAQLQRDLNIDTQEEEV